MRKKTLYILILTVIVILIAGTAAICNDCVGLFIDTSQETEQEEEKVAKETTKKTEKKAEETKETAEETEETKKTEETAKKELTADLNFIAIFADIKPQGNVFIKIINNGPGELVKQKIVVTIIEERTTLTDPPTGSAVTGPGNTLEISIKPQETVDLPIGVQIDTTQYNYRFEITIEPVGFVDPDSNNNKVVELISG